MQTSKTHHLTLISASRWTNVIILLVAIISCAGNSTQSVSKKLIGRWQIVEFNMPGIPPEDTAMIKMIQQAGAAKDKFGFMNFKSGGQLQLTVMKQSETLEYMVRSDTLIINTKGGQPNEPMLISFKEKDITAQITNLKGDKVYIIRRMSK